MEWSSIRDEAVSYLRALLQLETVNPPGNELAACLYVAETLAREGIESTLIEAAPARGSIIARLQGNGSAAPLLIMAHLDVVPAEADKWTYPPFAAEIHNGYVYGRGALDTKDLVAIELMVFVLLKRSGIPLARDVILMFNADEEAGGHLGAGWIVKNHPDLIRAEYAINEGGGFGATILGKRIYTVQTGEKGTARFTLRAQGKPGHASVPQSENAVLKLARGLSILGEAQLPMHLVPTARLYIEGLSKAVGGNAGAALRALVDGKNGKRALDNLPFDDGMRGMLYAMTHNTATPTKLSAGSKINVIPSYAEAQVDARILPGQTPESFLRELRTHLDPSYGIEFHQPTTQGIESEPQSPLYDIMGRVLTQNDPEAILLPDLVVGATDARHVTKLGTKVYGFCPMFDHASEMERVHGHDERVSLENIGFGTRVLYQVVSEFASPRMNPDDVVLVALVNTPRDLELVEREHWYRIPARHAPKHFTGADYLAFYLPRAFGDRKWSIDTFARVRGHELARRRDLLPDEPTHPRADELYYKLQLGPLEKRAPPIISKRGRRILFLWTNWEKFSAAREINQLFLRTPAHEKLWDALQANNLDVEREMIVREGRARYRVDFLVYLPQGQLAITLTGDHGTVRAPRGSHNLILSSAQVQDQFERTLEQIRSAARDLGQPYSEVNN